MKKKSGMNTKDWNRTNKSSLTVRIGKRLLTLAILIGLLFYGGGGWYFSNKLFTIGLSGAARRSLKPSYDTPIAKVSPTSITLELSKSTPSEATTTGIWGLEWKNGAGEITNILSQSTSSVTRTFKVISGPPPVAGDFAAIDERVFPVNPQIAFGYNYQNVDYPGPLGKYPAWYIPGKGKTWAITVHGNGMTRLDGMSSLPVLHSMGIPTLMITYRNDPGAPRSKSDLLRYGQTEWEDLQASVKYALSQGATHIILLGYSMGGSVVTSFLLNSQLASKVTAAVLDAPALDFSKAVDFGASQMDLPVLSIQVPQSLTDSAKWIASWRFGVDWNRLDYLKKDRNLHTPILLFQGLNDKTVPPSTSNQLAKDRPHLVRYITTQGAGHLESFNLHPTRYQNYLRDFIEQHLS